MISKCKIFFMLLFFCVVSNLGHSTNQKCKNIYLTPNYYSPFDVEISCIYRSDCIVFDSNLCEIYRFKQVYYTYINNLIEKAKKKHLSLAILSCKDCKDNYRIQISNIPIEFDFVEISPSDIIFKRNTILIWNTSKKYQININNIVKTVWLEEREWKAFELLRTNKKILINQTAFFNSKKIFPYLTKPEQFFKCADIPLRDFNIQGGEKPL